MSESQSIIFPETELRNLPEYMYSREVFTAFVEYISLTNQSCPADTAAKLEKVATVLLESGESKRKRGTEAEKAGGSGDAETTKDTDTNGRGAPEAAKTRDLVYCFWHMFLLVACQCPPNDQDHAKLVELYLELKKLLEGKNSSVTFMDFFCDVLSDPSRSALPDPDGPEEQPISVVNFFTFLARLCAAGEPILLINGLWILVLALEHPPELQGRITVDAILCAAEWMLCNASQIYARMREGHATKEAVRALGEFSGQGSALSLARWRCWKAKFAFLAGAGEEEVGEVAARVVRVMEGVEREARGLDAGGGIV